MGQRGLGYKREVDDVWLSSRSLSVLFLGVLPSIVWLKEFIVFYPKKKKKKSL